MTNEETVSVLLGVTGFEGQGEAGEMWLTMVVERLHAKGYMLAPSTCADCDRWLELRCAVHGAVPD